MDVRSTPLITESINLPCKFSQVCVDINQYIHIHVKATIKLLNVF